MNTGQIAGQRSITLTTSPADYDSPWKEALETYLEPFFALLFPRAHAEIDWDRGFKFLDKELQRAGRDARLGRRLVDKLVQVWRRDGTDAWVLVHIEVQSQEEAAFAERMYVYNYRLFDRHHREVVSLAVLGDERRGWRPRRYSRSLWECEVRFRFPFVKLLDLRRRWSELAASRNPFATVVMAHLEAQATREDAPGRLRAKLALTRRLYDLGFSRADVLNLFRFIDWVMALPEPLETQFRQEMERFEEAEQMPYITSVERYGLRKGREEGRVEGRVEGLREGLLKAIALGVDLKFGEAGRPILAEVEQIADVAVLEAVYERIKGASSPADLRQVYAPPAQD